MTFFAVQVGAYPPGSVPCQGVACFPVATSLRWLQLALGVFALVQLVLSVYQLALQRWILTASRHFGARRTIGVLPLNIVPCTLLNAVLFCLQQADPYGVDGIWPLNHRFAIALLLKLSTLVVAFVTSAITTTLTLQLAFNAQMRPFPRAVPLCAAGWTLLVVLVVYVGAALYLKFSSLSEYYFIVFATYFGGYLINLCLFNAYAIKILVYTYRTAMDLERASHPHHKVQVHKV
jgi:hypothetical protein